MEYIKDVASAIAFNRGCDARLAGIPLIFNPYKGEASWQSRGWIEGWNHVDKAWGLDNRSAKPLPEIATSSGTSFGELSYR
jgi:hypothetical protein